MCSFLFAFQLRLVTLQCFFLDYKNVDYDTKLFLVNSSCNLHTHKKNVQLILMIGTNRVFETPRSSE